VKIKCEIAGQLGLDNQRVNSMFKIIVCFGELLPYSSSYLTVF